MNKFTKTIIIVLLIVGLFLIYNGYSYQKNNLTNNNKLLTKYLQENNSIVTTNSGLYKIGNNYYFKGDVTNNYLQIFNRLYRIVSFNKEIKIVSNVNEATFYYGNSPDYLSSNIYNWLNKTDKENSGIYYNSIKNIENLLVPKNYCIYTYSNNKTICKEKYQSYFSLLSIKDYLDSGTKESYLNNGTSSFLLGYNSNNEKLNKEEDGSIKNISKDDASGIRVIMTLKKGLNLKKGTGTKNDPYIIAEEKTDNYINKYLKLDKDLYQIYEENTELLKLKLTTSLKEKKNFSNKLSGFNPLNKNNIAYYLNNTYYESLKYKEQLSSCTFYTGAIEPDKNYFDIYKSISSTKIGLINIFDLNITGGETSSYLLNTSKEDLETSYVYDKFGHILIENSTTLEKIIPVICLKKNLIKDGTGTSENPYIIE